jgi:hypothetical protein
MRRDAIMVLGFASLVALLLIGGCGGHNGQVPAVNPPGTAAFVGRAVCAACHDGINTAFGSSAHGLNFLNAHGLNLITGFGGACAPCHVTGFEEPTGWTSVTKTPQLNNISCEECHGPGSVHAGGPSSSNITLLPTASTTCWDCHVPEYKLLRSTPDTVTNATLSGTAPGQVHVYHGQAAFLMGYLGFNRPQTTAPHSFIDNTCVTCHLNPASERKHGATGLEVDWFVCVQCHGSEAAAQGLVEEVQAETKAALIELGGEDPANPGEPDPDASGGLLAAYAAANGIDLSTNSDPGSEAVKNYKAARHNYSYVLSSAAGGAHNTELTDVLLADAKAKLQ